MAQARRLEVSSLPCPLPPSPFPALSAPPPPLLLSQAPPLPPLCCCYLLCRLQPLQSLPAISQSPIPPTASIVRISSQHPRGAVGLLSPARQPLRSLPSPLFFLPDFPSSRKANGLFILLLMACYWGRGGGWESSKGGDIFCRYLVFLLF